jgi:tRNA/tmRNA/rRNA uracil-C5-methylase (TrmA/RlmC/RlmD family)
VLGVEMCSSAVEDAAINAARNGVDNATFVCSRGELLGGLCLVGPPLD